jgi:hypothetical protein
MGRVKVKISFPTGWMVEMLNRAEQGDFVIVAGHVKLLKVEIRDWRLN